MKIAVAGQIKLGGFVMRGVQLAERMGWDVINLADQRKLKQNWDVIVLVKNDCGRGAMLQNHCGRLIYDPLDVWSRYWPDAHPAQFWKERFSKLKFSDIIATSPSAAESMSNALPQVKVHLAPHHCDFRVNKSWFDRNGPIVYAGGRQYLGGEENNIKAACAKLGKKFKITEGKGAWEGLRGGCLALAVRLSPTDTPLNRIAKPDVKLENAAAAGMPVLASNHPCITTLRPEVVVAPEGCSDWVKCLEIALNSKPLENPVTILDHVAKMKEIIHG